MNNIETSGINKSWLTVVIVAGILYIIGQYVASQPQRLQKEIDAKREITVQGHGEVISKPDVARITLGVQTGPQTTAKAALDILTTRFNAVAGAVKSAGVKEDDVKTTNLSVNPVYDFTDGRQTIRGFEASESIQVTVRDLDKIGEVLAQATAQGANQAGGLSLEVDKPEDLQAEAQKIAIDDARDKAERLAKALGVGLGRVKNFSTSENKQGPQPVFESLRAVGQGGDAVAPEVPVGTQEITSDVSITYELK